MTTGLTAFMAHDEMKRTFPIVVGTLLSFSFEGSLLLNYSVMDVSSCQSH